MKSPPILILVALAAFASGAHASQPKKVVKTHQEGWRKWLPSTTTETKLKEGLITTLPREIHSEMAHRFTDVSLRAYASASHGSNKAVEEYREDKLLSRLQPILTRLNIKKNSLIVKSLIAARTLGAKSHIPLDRFIVTTGLDELNKSPALVQELALITVPLATGLPNAIVIADPHSLLQLVRITGPFDGIRPLFKQNAAQFNNGLGIDDTWLYGLLDWFLLSIDSNNKHSALYLALLYIRYSHVDISRIFCSAIFSVLDSKAVTSEGYAEVLNRMWQPMSMIWAVYEKYMVYPPNQILQKRKSSFVKDPKAFNLKKGINACFKEHPSFFALVAGIDSLFGKVISNQDRELHRFKVEKIFQSIIRIVDVDAEDLWWLLFSQQLHGSSYSELFEYALKNTRSAYMGKWNPITLKWLFYKLYEHQRYKDIVTLMNNSSVGLHPSDFFYLTSELTAAASGAKISKTAHNMLLEKFS